MSRTEDRNLHFGIYNCRDLYDKLKFEHARLRETQYKNKYDVFNFIVTAYHLNDDWLSKDIPSRPRLANNKRGNAPVEMRQIVQAIKDLANSNKHMSLDKNGIKQKVVDAVLPDEIRDWNSYFHGPHFGIPIGEHYYSCPILVDLIMSYFHWIFDDSIPVNEFPVEIKKQLARAVCTVKEGG